MIQRAPPNSVRSRAAAHPSSLIAWLALLLLPLLFASSAAALSRDRSINQFKHSRWTSAEGAPSSISSLAQGADGYIWLATYNGLFRFDGLTFERMDADVDVTIHGAPFKVFAARSGDIWVYYPDSRRFAVYRQGILLWVAAPRPEGTVSQLAETADGSLWIGGTVPGQPLLRLRGGKWSIVRVAAVVGRDVLNGMAPTSDGSLWLGYGDGVFRLRPADLRVERLIQSEGASFRLAVDPAERVWAVGNEGAKAITEARGRWTGQLSGHSIPVDQSRRRGQVLFDRDGNLWIARRKDGLQRVRQPELNRAVVGTAQIEEYREQDGLSSDAVYGIFEDREGNIWAGTTQGLDRFRDADIAAEPKLTKTAAFGDILFADPDGIVYIGQRDTLYRVVPGGSPQPILRGIEEPEAICGETRRGIWVSTARELILLSGGATRRFPKPPGIETGLRDCAVDAAGTLWASAEGSGLFTRLNGRWIRRFHDPTGRLRPGQMEKDDQGTIWANAGSGTLLRIVNGQIRAVRYAGRAGFDEARTMTMSRSGLLLAGNRGLAVIDGDRFSALPASRLTSLVGVNGVVWNPDGFSWLFARDGIARFRSADVEKAWAGSVRQVPVRLFDGADGLIDSNSVRPRRSLVRGGDGRIWATTATGIVWLDPNRLTSNPVAPLLSVRSVQAMGRRYRDPSEISLPAGSADVIVSFAVLSLRMPERAVVRYRLDGQDTQWVDPGSRRQAFYTNLQPGTYRFRIQAANESGIWSSSENAATFTIDPTFLQSTLFKLLIAVVIIALAGAFYVLRIRQLTARLQSRFDIRVAERERIARELHDTLLQGFQGLLLQFKGATKKMPEGELRANLDRTLAKAQQALVEGRDRVTELRSANEAAGLTEQIMKLVQETNVETRARIQLVQEGVERQLHPLVRDEILRITEEALRNALVHGAPTQIDMLLLWQRSGLGLAIRDNGTGIPAKVLKDGRRKGHYGLVGMRERADRLGGQLVVSSQVDGGTEVSITIPGSAAYREDSMRLSAKIRSLLQQSLRRFRRGKADEAEAVVPETA